MSDARTCPHCDAELPAGSPRFCIECGGPIGDQGGVSEPAPPPAAVGITVKLSNATVEQSVLGVSAGEVTGDAIPPGMWSADRAPAADDTLAVYVPLRAIVEGWSGLIDTGWRLTEQLPPERGSTAPRFRFEAEVPWFPAPGLGLGMRLAVRVQAEAEAQEGRSRRGFRYRSGYDPPMQVLSARWHDAQGAPPPRPLPLPRIQLMAPPRIPRVSDYREQILALPPQQALAWAREGKVADRFELLADRQQRTPAGRGLLLGAAGGFLSRLLGRPEPRYHVRFLSPLICSWREWQRMQAGVRAQAAELGLGGATDATVEWWLDREGYDGVILKDVGERYPEQRRVAIAFRRSQVAAVEGP